MGRPLQSVTWSYTTFFKVSFLEFPFCFFRRLMKGIICLKISCWF